ncbi:MAG: SRPBCC family protein [Flavobacteriales bacterium]
MRALKTILIILLGLAALFVVLGSMGPKTVSIQRSTTIGAPASLVYPRIASLRRMYEWSPWKDMEKSQRTSFSGTDGQVGSLQVWEGDTVGKGSMEVVELDPDKHVGNKLKFIEPWESESKVDLDLTTVGDSTKVTWKMTSENGLMGRVMSVFMNMDKMIGPDLEKGLAKLKAMSEQEQAEVAAAQAKLVNGFDIATLDRPAQLYAGVRKRIKWSEMKDFFAKNFASTYGEVGKAGVIPDVATGVYFEWDEQDQMADVMAAVAVPAEAKDKLKGVKTYETPASKAYEIVYTGGYAGSVKAHEAMAQKMQADGVQMNANVIEEYVTGPGKEPDSTKWVTNIIYLVK